jgi:hypothetical protein
LGLDQVIRLADVVFTNAGNTTNSGLWRYLIGDTVRFVIKSVPCIGRTKHHINVFGRINGRKYRSGFAKACKQPKWKLSITPCSIFMEGKEKVPMNG